MIAAVGGVLLLVSLFLEWYEPGLTAWDTFELADIVLASAGVAAIASLFGPLVTHRITPDPVGSRGLFFLGLGALIIIVAGLIQSPPAALESTPQLGAWLGLVGALVVTGGALLATSRISVVVSLDRRERVTPPEGTDVVPPPPGTPPAPPHSETTSFPTEPR